MRSFVLALSLALTACGSDDAEENVDAEGCEHLEEGPAAPVTASAEADITDSPAVATDHKRYDVTLPALAGGSGRGGFVKFQPSEATDYVIFLSATVPLAITDANGTSVPIEDTVDGSDQCTAIARKHVVELAAGTYFFELGGDTTIAASVQLVLEEAAGHEH
jgi:hypothetical protein